MICSDNPGLDWAKSAWANMHMKRKIAEHNNLRGERLFTSFRANLLH